MMISGENVVVVRCLWCSFVPAHFHLRIRFLCLGSLIIRSPSKMAGSDSINADSQVSKFLLLLLRLTYLIVPYVPTFGDFEGV